MPHMIFGLKGVFIWTIEPVLKIENFWIHFLLNLSEYIHTLSRLSENVPQKFSISPVFDSPNEHHPLWERPAYD